MKRYASHKILPEFRLILECCKGLASVNDAIKMKKDELSDVLFNPEYNIIVDFREFETDINSKTTESIQDFFSFLTSLKLKSKVAILTAGPHQVVVSLILKELSHNSQGFRIEVFSTIVAAVRYLGFPVDKTDRIRFELERLNKVPG
jgi:hypothetical protein